MMQSGEGAVKQRCVQCEGQVRSGQVRHDGRESIEAINARITECVKYVSDCRENQCGGSIAVIDRPPPRKRARKYF